MLMKCAMNNTFSRIFALLFFIFVFLGSFELYAQKPTVVTGMFGEYSLLAEEVEGDTDFGIHGLVSYRTLLENRGYASIKASMVLSGLGPGMDLSDIENLHILVSTPAGGNRLEISGEIAASLTGIDESGRFILPEWKVLYRLERDRRSIRPYGSYRGYYYSDELKDNNRYYNGIEAGLIHAPSIEFEYRGSIHTGLEKWLNEDRYDLLSGVKLQLHGLVGYFISWKVEGDAAYRISFNELQDIVTGSAIAELGWSPGRRLSMKVRAGYAQEFYLETRESDHSLKYALRMDYMAAENIYLFAENNTSWSNPFADQFESWKFQLKGGLDMSL